MKIVIDTNQLVKYRLTPTEYIVIKQLEVGVNQFSIDKSRLEAEGWIENNKPSTKFKNTFELSCEEWIEEWRNLFPKGIKTGGYPVRSTVNACKVKMNKFLIEYDYSKEDIFKATKNYIDQKRREGYGFMKTAVYFIEKDKQSILASFCEEGSETEKEISKGYDI